MSLLQTFYFVELSASRIFVSCTSPTFTTSSRAIHCLLTCRRQIYGVAQRSISSSHEGDLPSMEPLRQNAKGVARVPKSFIPTGLLPWSAPYVSAQKRHKKLISKRQVAELFGVSTHTIDCWLHDGKLPEPKRTVLWAARWDYEELVARTRLKSRLYR
jgi:predicted DNA-binding transcriptional regulator AlpA